MSDDIQQITGLEAKDIPILNDVIRKLKRDIDDNASYDQNVIIHANSDTTIDVDTLQINIQGHIKTSLDVTINTAITGANGLDTGSLGASTWYYVWGISGADTAGLLSTSSTNPIIPKGYTSKRLIGYALTDGDSDLLKAYQFMNEFMWDVSIVMTTTPVDAWTALDCSAAIPSGVRVGIFGLYIMDDNSSFVRIGIRPTGSAGGGLIADFIWVQGPAVNVGIAGQKKCMTDSSQSIDYNNISTVGTTVSINVEGFICGLF